jgi:hypothetical protein
MRLRRARAKKAAKHAPAQEILKSVVGDGGKRRSARSWMGPVNRARAAAGLREYKSEDPIQRYLKKRKTPRS